MQKGVIMVKKQILIVDDDAELCEELGEILKGEGFAVETVLDGTVGQEKIASYDYDLLILDVKMPGINGIQILNNVKNKKPGCKFCMISGKPNMEKSLRDGGVHHLVDCVIPKPFKVEELLRKINACLFPDAAGR